MKSLPLIVRSLGAGLVLASTLPAPAQTPPPEEIVIVGRYGTVPDSVQSLSAPVSYADLDLSTKAGQDELKHRVSLTARFLCNRLGESDTSSGVVPSCRDGAVRDAMNRVGTIEQGFAPRGTTWVAGTPWSPPYPSDWVTKYP